MSGHTPGPWHVGPHYTTDVESRHGRICECGPMGAPQAITNARLIAAAPELLEACRAIVAFHQSFFVGLPLTIDGKPIDHTLVNRANELARSAIMKAEGR